MKTAEMKFMTRTAYSIYYITQEINIFQNNLKQTQSTRNNDVNKKC